MIGSRPGKFIRKQILIFWIVTVFSLVFSLNYKQIEGRDKVLLSVSIRKAQISSPEVTISVIPALWKAKVGGSEHSLGSLGTD